MTFDIKKLQTVFDIQKLCKPCVAFHENKYHVRIDTVEHVFENFVDAKDFIDVNLFA